MESRVRELEASLSEMRARLARLEEKLGVSAEPLRAETFAVPPPEAVGEAAVEAAHPDAVGKHAISAVALAGRSLLVLGGAFVIRALAEEGVLAGPAGPLLGLGFAAIWVFQAYRAGAKDLRGSATVHGLTSAVIIYPLVLESATRMAALPHALSGILLAVYTAALFVVAVRLHLALLAWMVVFACVLTALGLLRLGVEDHGLTVLVLGMAVAAAWGADRNGWTGLRWPAAVAAEVLTFRSAMLVSHANPPEGTAGAAIALALSVLALATFALLHRTLWRKLALRFFEVGQAALAFVVAVSAVVLVTSGPGPARLLVGAVLLVLSVAAFLISLGVVADSAGRAFDCCIYALFGTGLVFAGGALAFGAGLRAVLWGSVGLALAVVGRNLRPRTVWSMSTLLVLAAAVSSGLGQMMYAGLLAGSEEPLSPVGRAAKVVFALALLAYAAVTWGPPESARGSGAWSSRVAPAFLLVFDTLAVTALFVLFLRAELPSRAADASVLAATRTVAMAAAVLGMALASRFAWRRELTWAAYTLVGAGAFKILIEDLRHGRAVTLLIGFAAFGASLIGVSRLLAGARREHAQAMSTQVATGAVQKTAAAPIPEAGPPPVGQNR